MTDPTGRVFDALADPNRRYVVEALAERETATATELAAELPVSRQAVAGRISASGLGLHWDELDEDISVAGLLAGRGDMTAQHPAAA